MINNLVHSPVARSVYQLVIDSYRNYFPASLKLDFTSNLLDERINFSRTTNATITRSDGTIGYAPHNLLAYSEQFDNAYWQKQGSGTTVIANSTEAPDGTLTADTVILGGVTYAGILRASLNLISSDTYTLSFWVKAGTREAELKVITNTAVVLGAYTPTTDWQRVIITFSANTTALYLASTTTDTSGGSIYLWGAQLEIGSTATAYNSTTVKNLLGYSELFDNAAWAKSNSFVQTNLLTYSEAFDNAAWVKTRVSTPSAGVIQDSATTGTHDIYKNFTHNGTSTLSVELKEGTIGYVMLWAFLSSTVKGVLFDLTTGTFVSNANDANTVTSYLVGSLTSDGYRRYSITYSLTGAGQFGFSLSSTSTPSYTATRLPVYDGSGDGNVLIRNAQLVQGSVAGDYRRTDAAALPVYYPNHNGVVCAEKLVESTATSSPTFAEQFVPTSGAIYTASLHIKAAERGFAFVGFNGGSLATTFISVNLSTGAVSIAAGTPLNYSSVDVGNGYYRVSITLASTGTSASFVEVRVSADGIWANRNYTGTGTSGIYIFGAQLSDSASLDPYVLNAGAAPAAAAYYGARFDYDPVTLEAKGLLIEEQRANLLLRSEEFENASWVKSLATITANSITSPDGTIDAEKLIAASGSGLHFIRQDFTGVDNTTYTASVYAKVGELEFLGIEFIGQDAVVTGIGVNLTTGVIGAGRTGTTATTASVTSVGSGWYRITLTANIGLGAAVERVNIFAGTGFATGFNFNGDDTSGIYIWGAQLEAGAFATSYIPTTASQVTRAADVATIQGSNFYSWYNQNEGSLVVNQIVGNPAVGTTSINIDDGVSFQNSMWFGQLVTPSSVRLQSTLYNNITQSLIQGFSTLTFGLNLKTVGAYKINDFAGTINGNDAVIDTSGVPPIGARVNIGQISNGGQILNGHIKQISYYPQRLSNEVIKGLTA